MGRTNELLAMVLTAGTRLGPYTIVEPIGAGGMGRVYLATDIRLGRRVAVKVLREDLAGDADRRTRFEQEARAASSLNHPNIVTIHDIGTEGSVHYIAMEHVEGDTLRNILHHGSLPFEKLLPIATQIAEGLAKAHSAGIVHRDLKPENLMVTVDGYVKILDFGLAKLLPHASILASERVTLAKAVTEDGLLLGTVHYMSPEQARGRTLDNRSDQFSFGAILYEMATGRPAFDRETAAQILAAIIEDAPEPLLDVSPDLPAHWVAVVERCLRKSPDERYPTSNDLVAALARSREIRAAVPETRLSKDSIRAVAVMPLNHMGAGPDQDYFADAMTEALTIDLAKIRAIKVISTTSALRYRGTDKPLREIARELDVDAVIEGSVLRAENRVRIAARLVDAETNEHLWAESYERDFRDVLALQSEVARAIAREIKVKLAPDEKALFARARPVDPAAHDAFLKGRYYLHKSSPDGWNKALGYFRLALEADPDYGPAHAGLADTHNVLGVYGLDSPARAFARARAAASRAIELDEMHAEAHASLAVAKLVDRDSEAIELEFRRSLELNPGSASSRAQYALFCRMTGRPEKSLSEIEHAHELDPLSPLINSAFAYLLYSVRRYEDAIRQCEKTLSLDPGVFQVHAYLAMIYRRMDRVPEAAREWRQLATLLGARKLARAMRRMHDESGFKAGVLHFARAASRTFHLIRMLRYLPFGKPRRVSTVLIAMLYAEAGDHDRAISWLEKSCALRDPQIFGLSVNPHWDGLRSDPRFEAMIRRAGLPRLPA